MKFLVSFFTVFFMGYLLFSESPVNEEEFNPSSYTEERTILEENRQAALSEFLNSLNQIKRNPGEYLSRMAQLDPSLFNKATGADLNQRPLNLHWIEQIPSSFHIRLEDGSQWSCGVDDALSLRNWRAQDDVEIAPNSSFFTPHDYKFILINKTVNSSIIVNMVAPPNPTNTYTHKVQRIEYDSGMVYLMNGHARQSRWEVHPRDKELIKGWKVQDILFVGIDVHWLWWLNSYDHILIHVKSGIPIHVKRI